MANSLQVHTKARVAIVLALLAGCSSANDVPGAGTGGAPSPVGGSKAGDGGATSAGPTAGEGGPGGAAPDGGRAAAPDGGASGPAGKPGSCVAGVPARGTPVDTSRPTTVVGTGDPASCTFAALSKAVAKGGVITFACGPAPVTIVVTSTLDLPVDKDTLIDGGRTITLDGGGAVRILSFASPNFRATDFGVTLQHLTLTHGKTTPTKAIPVAPSPCSQGWDDGEGGAVYVRDGGLTVIDAIFVDNQGAAVGPDTGGGAIYALGSKPGVMIVSSTFTGNRASNGAAVGTLFAELDIYDSLISNNVAVGNGANSDDASKCSVTHNGQHEVGSGGNGGAIANDGQSVDVTLCGDEIVDNHAGAGAFGGGLFFTSNDMMGTLSIADTTMTGNTGGSWTHVSTGSVTNAGTAVGTNAKSIRIDHSTLQGLP